MKLLSNNGNHSLRKFFRALIKKKEKNVSETHPKAAACI